MSSMSTPCRPGRVDYLSGEVQKKANLTVWNYACGSTVEGRYGG